MTITRRLATSVVLACAVLDAGSAGSRAQVIYGTTATHTYLELVDIYRHADANAAVADLARWDSSRIASELKLPGDNADPWQRAAAAALALEADLRSVQNLDPEPSNRSQKALTMMPALLASARHAGDQKLLRFCHDWFVAAGALAARFPTAGFPVSSDVIRLGFDQDPQLLLMAGASAEASMGPLADQVPGTRPMDQLKRGLFDHALGHDAEDYQRKALEVDPSLVEARLHIGRTIFMLGRDRDAQPELEQALKDATAAKNSAVIYLAALFLGELHAENGRTAEAEQSFSQATTIQPLGAAGWLGLGRERLAAGRADGWPTIARLFSSPTGLPVDPWYVYLTPYYDELAPRLAALRAMGRE